MNSLRALSTRASCSCISLNVRVSWPSSSSESSGSGSMKLPAATCLAARLEPAHAARNRARHEVAAHQGDQERDAARDKHARADQRTGVLNIAEVTRVDGDPAGALLARRRSGTAAWAVRRPPTLSTPAWMRRVR